MSFISKYAEYIQGIIIFIPVWFLLSAYTEFKKERKITSRLMKELVLSMFFFIFFNSFSERFIPSYLKSLNLVPVEEFSSTKAFQSIEHHYKGSSPEYNLTKKNIDASSLNPLQDFDGFSREDILTKRKEIVLQSHILIDGPYHPRDEVFGKIKDGLPWHGTYGTLLSGLGFSPQDGPSFHTGAILNPMALVFPHFWGAWLPYMNILDKSKLSSDFHSKMTLLPQGTIELKGSEKRIILTFDTREYFNQLRPYFMPDIIDFIILNFDLSNAKDFGFPYFYFFSDQISPAFHIQQNPATYGTVSSSYQEDKRCGFQPGCNYLQSLNEELNGILLKDFPHRIYFKLWREKPLRLSDKEDVLVEINFL
jgi:hypothetical protein